MNPPGNLSVFDYRYAREEDFLDVLAAGQKHIDDVGDLVQVAPGLCIFPSVHKTLGMEH